MKVLIVDNEIEIRTGLRLMLNAYCPNVTEIEEADGVVSGLKAIYSFNPDLVFTDVEMDDGTGIEMLSKTSNTDFQVIFITAYNKYAVDAFKFSAIDFLLKPINPDDLVKSIGKVHEKIKTDQLLKQLNVFQEQRSVEYKIDKRIVLKELNSMHIIKVADIIYCEAEGIYTKFVIENIPAIIISRNLKEYDDMLSSYGFLRIHNAFLVNSNRILKFDKSEGGVLILQGAETIPIPVSQRKKELLIKYLKEL